MDAIIKGVSISPEQYSFTVKYKNYDGTSNDLMEQVVIPRNPPRERDVVMGECESVVRDRLRGFIRLLSTDYQVTEFVKVGITVTEV